MEDSRRDLKDDNLNSLVPDVRVDRRGEDGWKRMLAWFNKHGVA